MLGEPAVYETDLSLPGSGALAGIAWMDTRLLSARMYSGSDESPGVGPWRYTAQVSLLPPDRGRGCVQQRLQSFRPLKAATTPRGAGSCRREPAPRPLVIFANKEDGAGRVGKRGANASPSSRGKSLSLLVAGSRPLADASIVGDWGGVTLEEAWRYPGVPGLGVTRNGALVYVMVDLDPLSLAELTVESRRRTGHGAQHQPRLDDPCDL